MDVEAAYVLQKVVFLHSVNRHSPKMKFLSAIALALSTLPFMASAAATAPECRPFCCDALVPSIRPAGNVGILDLTVRLAAKSLRAAFVWPLTVLKLVPALAATEIQLFGQHF
uniref:Uncharacterized protein n=1 Tax=Psilocybe cubensis TaxID=181762 RepID=A0A8H8CML3_PSICU